MTSSVTTLRIGMPQEITGSFGVESFISGFRKSESLQPITLKVEGLLGDGQADKRHHGGPEKAICVYSLQSYQRLPGLGLPTLKPGDFGENFTVDGQDELTVSIGDRFQLGDEVVVEVSQPRAPCWKLAQINGRKRLALECQESGLTGWYLRVITEGVVQAGQIFKLLERPHGSLTISRVNSAAYGKEPPDDLLKELIDCSHLSQNWRDKFQKKLAKLNLDATPRLYGPAS